MNGMKKYKNTLNLPKTNFPIKLKPQNEMQLVEKWEKEDTFNSVKASRPDAPDFVLHDGPPYANGDLHHGHLLNKVLKDIVCKYKTLTGHKVDFRPGWDCHGLPIETQVDKKLGPKRHDMSKVELRKKYREYAAKFVDVQREQFKRYGALAEWDNPYVTMDFKYEAQTLRELARLVDAGLLYRDYKPVFWCPTHRTALADSEIEYADDHESLAVYSLFHLHDDEYVAVWTTTPWTLPGNFAIAANSDAQYSLYELDYNRKVWVATERLESVLSDLGADFNPALVLRTVDGTYFCGQPYNPQFENHTGGVIGFSDHVTTESGTGFVHIAPAHGEDDFRYGKKHHLPIQSVINDQGKTVYSVKSMCGMTPQAANDEVADYLYDADLLLKAYKYKHRYPYSSRSHRPVLMKTTRQWFVNLDKTYNNGPSLRERALKAIDEVEWLPAHGYNRIKGMLESRPDWCLSRQRTWGVPIVVLYCNDCGKEFVDSGYMNKVADMMEERGSDFWFADNKPNTETCKCGSINFSQETDILDVWFDSGVSNAAVMNGKTVDLYLEGSDQHRGWFQATLLAALGCRELVPYKSVLTHGFVVDDKGEKLSKSKGNYVDLQKTIARDGAELWRLWVAMSEFKRDVRVSQAVLDGVKQAQHKIRNTVRFMLSNLHDFDVSQDYTYLNEVDKYIVDKWLKVCDNCINAYEKYDFHTVVHSILQFCINDLSTFYFDVAKDILYCDKTDSHNRRSVQSAFYFVSEAMILLMAPIMSFSMEDAWRELTGKDKSVFFVDALSTMENEIDTQRINRYEAFREIRETVFVKLEQAREQKLIGPFYEACVTLGFPLDKLDIVAAIPNLAMMLQVSQVVVKPSPKITVQVDRAEGPQCQRCWNYHPVVKDTDVCERCFEALDEGSFS